jgi:phosphohistidine phosphatase SixA
LRLLPQGRLATGAIALTVALAIGCSPGGPGDGEREAPSATGDVATTSTPTRVYLLRHAEKLSGDDPLLSPEGEARAASLAALLDGEPIEHVFASEYRRTQETVRPLTDALGLELEVVPAADTRELVRRIVDHPGETIVVCGHSNTVPEIASALGWEGSLEIADDQYGDLFLLELSEPPRLTKSTY